MTSRDILADTIEALIVQENRNSIQHYELVDLERRVKRVESERDTYRENLIEWKNRTEKLESLLQDMVSRITPCKELDTYKKQIKEDLWY